MAPLPMDARDDPQNNCNGAINSWRNGTVFAASALGIILIFAVSALIWLFRMYRKLKGKYVALKGLYISALKDCTAKERMNQSMQNRLRRANDGIIFNSLHQEGTIDAAGNLLRNATTVPLPGAMSPACEYGGSATKDLADERLFVLSAPEDSEDESEHGDEALTMMAKSQPLSPVRAKVSSVVPKSNFVFPPQRSPQPPGTASNTPSRSLTSSPSTLVPLTPSTSHASSSSRSLTPSVPRSLTPARPSIRADELARRATQPPGAASNTPSRSLTSSPSTLAPLTPSTSQASSPSKSLTPSRSLTPVRPSSRADEPAMMPPRHPAVGSGHPSKNTEAGKPAHKPSHRADIPSFLTKTVPSVVAQPSPLRKAVDRTQSSSREDPASDASRVQKPLTNNKEKAPVGDEYVGVPF